MSSSIGFFDKVKYRFLRSIHARLGRSAYALGFYELSASQFKKCLHGLKFIDLTKNYSARCDWDFYYQRSLSRLGRCEYDDPLFSFDCEPLNEEKSRAGWYSIRTRHYGISFYGYNRIKDTNVSLFVDGIKVKQSLCRKSGFRRGYFKMAVKRPALKGLPASSEIKIVNSKGDLLLYKKRYAGFRFSYPSGDGALLRDSGGRALVDKKGFPVLTDEQVSSQQNLYLNSYAFARDFFDNKLNKKLFILYGTLLGYYREKDFIKGDDDFDAGYVSSFTNAADVKRETMDLVIELVLSGFICSFNRNGRLFRLRHPDDPPGLHLDVRPVWFEGGKAWLHKKACLPMAESDFLPVSEGKLRGEKVFAPADVEKFLLNYYGPGWHTPDPSYSNSTQKTPANVSRHLKRICVTPEDYETMLVAIEARKKDYPKPGALISIGLHPLYPLSEYEANCEW